jgi:Zn-dependent protease with chaperone function
MVSEERQQLPVSLISTTTLRFVMLSATATAIVAETVRAVLPYLVNVLNIGDERAINQCYINYFQQLAQAWRHSHTEPSNLKQPTCPNLAVSTISLTIWPLVSVILFWALLTVSLWLLPGWRIRRRRYERTGRIDPDGLCSSNLQVSGSLGLLERLTGLQQSAGLTVPVTYYLDRLDPRSSALAFGRPGLRCVVLSGGLERLACRDPEAFNAIVLHELAHIRNRDIDIGFFTILAWRFTLPILAWMAYNDVISSFITRDTSDAATAFDVLGGCQTLVLGVVGLLLRNSVLRSRETFADHRVVLWTKQVDCFAKMLTDYFPERRARWRQPLKVHPPRGRRIAVLQDTSLLRPTNVWDWCAVGFVAAALAWAISEAWPTGEGSDAGLWVSYFVAALFLTGALGIEAWANPQGRQVTARLSADASVAAGLSVGLALGSGLLDPTTGTVVLSVHDSAAITQFAMWLLVLFGMAWLARKWLGLVAASWVYVVAARRRRGAALSWWVLAVVAAVPVVLTLLYFRILLILAFLYPLFSGPLVPFGILLLFVWELLSWFWLLVLVVLIVLLLPYTGRCASHKRLRRLVYVGGSYSPDERLQAAHMIATKRVHEGGRAFHHLASARELPADDRVEAAIRLARIRMDIGAHMLTWLVGDPALTPSARLRATQELGVIYGGWGPFRPDGR